MWIIELLQIVATFIIIYITLVSGFVIIVYLLNKTLEFISEY